MLINGRAAFIGEEDVVFGRALRRPAYAKVALGKDDAFAFTGRALKGDLRLAHRARSGRGRGCGRLRGELGAIDVFFQIVLGAGVEHAIGRERLIAQIGVHLLLEVDNRLRGGGAEHAVGAVQVAEIDQLLLHIADGLGVGVCVHEHVVVLIAGRGLRSGRRRGRRLRGRLGGGGGSDRVVHVVFKQTQCGRVAVAADGQGVVALLFVGPHLEIAHGDGGGRAVNAVHAIQEAQIAQHGLQVTDAFRGGIRADAAFRRSRGRKRGRSCGRGRGGGGRDGGCGRGTRALPPVGKDNQVIARGGIHLAGHFQHLAAVIAVHKGLELPYCAARGCAVDAIIRTGRKLAQGDEQLLHAADVAAGGVFVDEEIVLRRFGDHWRQRGRTLRGPGGDGGLIQPIQRLRAGDAIHGEFGVDGVGFVHIGLEIAHGLAGGAVIHAGGLRGVQPTQGDQLPLQAGDFLSGGIAADDLAGRPRRGVGRRGGRAHVAGLVLVVLILIRSGDIVHPGKIRIGDGGEGGLHIGRGRGRDRRRPQRIRCQRGHGCGGSGGVKGVGKQTNEHKSHHQHGHRRAADDQRPLARGTAFAFLPGSGAGGRGVRGGLALGDIGGAIFLKIEVALFGVFHGLNTGLQALHALFKGVLSPGHGRHGAIVQAPGAVARQIFADAQRRLALGIVGHIDDAAGILPHGPSDQEAAVVEHGAGQELYLRHRGTRIAPAVRAHVVTVEVFEAVHTFVFVCHGVHSFVSRKSERAFCVLANTSSIVPVASTPRSLSGS